jgi:hypothetical protein
MMRKYERNEDTRNNEFFKQYCMSDNQIGLMHKFNEKKV